MPSDPFVGRIPGPGVLSGIRGGLARDWIDRGERWVQKYGDIFRLRVISPRDGHSRTRWPIEWNDAVFVASGELIGEVMAQPAGILSGGEGRRFVEWYFGSESLLVLDGSEHLHERRRLLAVLTGEQVPRYQNTIRQVTAEAVERLPSTGRVGMANLVDEVVGAVALRLVFGRLPAPMEKRIQLLLRRANRSAGWSGPMMAMPWLQRAKLGPWSPGVRVQQLHSELGAFITAELERRRRQPTDDSDILSQLLSAEASPGETSGSPRWLGSVLTLLGGDDTVWVALSWCFYHLLRHPEMLARARDEARSGATATPSEDPSYLDAICLEAVRIHPPIPVLIRRALVPVTIGGFEIKPGAFVLGAIALAHKDRRVYPEPGMFRPERFLERRYSPQEFLPFGGGVRRCLGHALAFPQMKTMLAELLRTLDLTPSGPYSTGSVRRAVMMVPRDPLRVEFRRVAVPGESTRG